MITVNKKQELLELVSIRDTEEIHHNGQDFTYDVGNIRDKYPTIDIEALIRCLRVIWEDEYHYGEFPVSHCLDHAVDLYCQEKGICRNCGNLDTHNIDLDRFYRSIGVFVRAWGFLEANIRALHMMREPNGTFRARLPNDDWYEPTDDGFMKRVNSVFPEKRFPSTYTQLERVAEIRNYVTHNVMLKYCDGAVQFIHFDRYASEKAQHSVSCTGVLKHFGDSDVVTLENIESVTRDLKNFDLYLETLIRIISETHHSEHIIIDMFDMTGRYEFLRAWRSCEQHSGDGHWLSALRDEDGIAVSEWDS